MIGKNAMAGIKQFFDQSEAPIFWQTRKYCMINDSRAMEELTLYTILRNNLSVNRKLHLFKVMLMGMNIYSQFVKDNKMYSSFFFSCMIINNWLRFYKDCLIHILTFLNFWWLMALEKPKSWSTIIMWINSNSKKNTRSFF